MAGARQPEHDEGEQLRLELAEARAELARTREDLADIRNSFNQTPVLIAILKGPTHVFEFTNAAYLEVVAPGRDLLGMSIREFMPEQEHEKVVGYLDGVYRSGVPFVGKECGFEIDRRGDGRLSMIYFDFLYHPIRDAEGRINGVLVQAVDVSDRVLAREALKRENERIEAEVARRTCELASQKAFAEGIIQNVPVGVAVLDRDLIYRVSNPTHSQFLQLAPEQIVGRYLFDVLPGGESQIEPLLRGVLETGEPYHASAFPFSYTGPDGRVRQTYWDFCYIPVSLGGGPEIDGVIALATEISDRLEQAREHASLQRQQIEALEQADSVKDEFLSIISHELRTPVTTIRNAASILAKGRAGAMSEDQERFAQLIQSQSDRLIRLLDDLLDLQRLRSGGISYDCRSIDVREVASQVAHDFEPLAEERGIRVAIALGETPLVATVDQDRLAQVLVNLLSNAVKFTPAGGTITVRGSRTDDRIRLDVEDTGVGIPETDLTRIFDKFVQLDASLQQRTAGIGLGLAISRQIVEEGHRGRLLVTSELGRGSCFSVELPSEG